MSDRHGLRAIDGDRADSVKTWKRLVREYPEARYTADRGWFYGALRDADDVLRANDLGVLITRLLAREHHPEGTPGV